MIIIHSTITPYFGDVACVHRLSFVAYDGIRIYMYYVIWNPSNNLEDQFTLTSNSLLYFVYLSESCISLSSPAPSTVDDVT